MANRNNYNDNYNGNYYRNNGRYYPEELEEPVRKTGNGWKILAIILALILAAAAVIGIFGSKKDGKFFAESDIKKFFNGWGKGTGEEKPSAGETFVFVPQEMGAFVLSTHAAKNAPVALSGESTQIDGKNTCTLTATLEPSNAYYSSVTWKATNEDGDISGHIELIQNEANPLTVTVKLNGELFYTEQITVEVVSMETHTATCNVDYLAYPDGVSANVSGDFLKCGETYELLGTPQYWTTAGTITGFDLVIDEWYLEVKSDTGFAISSELGGQFDWGSAWEGDDSTLALGATPAAMFYMGNKTADEFNRAFFKVCNGQNDVLQLSLSCAFIYNGVRLAYVHGTSYVGIDSTSYAICLEGVNIGDIVFSD